MSKLSVEANTPPITKVRRRKSRRQARQEAQQALKAFLKEVLLFPLNPLRGIKVFWTALKDEKRKSTVRRRWAWQVLGLHRYNKKILAVGCLIQSFVLWPLLCTAWVLLFLIYLEKGISKAIEWSM